MKEFMRMDGPLMRFLDRLADMIGVSLLWLLCSLPLVTLGASTAGLYTVALQEADSGVVKPFFKGFKSSFKKATVAELIFLTLGIALAFDLRILGGVDAGWVQIPKILTWIVVVLLLIVLVYTFPLLAEFEQTLSQTLKNALLLGLSNLPATVLLLLLHVLPVVAIFLNPGMFVNYALPILTFMGAGVISTLCAWLLKRVFAKYQEKT